MLLWRIEPHTTGIRMSPTLAEDLALHLRYAPLTTVLVQIGRQQQAYVSTPGCPGCRHRRCTPECRMNLLRRILVANQVATDLRPVPLGLSARPYTRMALAVPGSHAQPLDADLLTPWRDARVWAVWRTVAGQRMVGAALAVGADGPEPLTALRERGWIGIGAPKPLVRQSSQPEPLALPYGWLWTTPAHMLLPRRLADHRETVIVTPPPMPPLTLPDTTMTTIPFRVGGQVTGILTVTLLAQVTQILIHSMRNEPSAGVPSVAPTIQVTNPPIDSSLTPGTHPEANPPYRRRMRVHRTWTPARPIADVVAPPGVDTDMPAAADGNHHATVRPESAPMGDGSERPGSPDPVTKHTDAADGASEPHTDDNDDEPDTPSPLPLSAMPWPVGPNLTASELESLLTAMVQEPRLINGRAGQVGLAESRIRAHYGIEPLEVRMLLCWLDQAGLIAPPNNPLHPWQYPRPWRTTDLAEIAHALAITPLPTDDDLADAFARS